MRSYRAHATCMSRMRAPVVWAAVALMTAACKGPKGLQVSAPRWTLVGPEVRIGSADEPVYAFGNVVALAEGPDSCLYSLHRNEPTVRKWTWDGHAADSIGRGGEGPGEFSAPFELGFFGDTLWVVDRRTFHASFFATDGRYLGEEAPHVDIGNGSFAHIPPRPYQPLRDGTWFGMTPPFSDPIARGTLTRVPLVRMDSSGAVLDTIWSQPFRPTDILALLSPSGNGGLYMPQPFGDTPLWHVLDDGSVVVMNDRVPHHATGARFSVTRIAVSGDTVWHVELPYTPTPLPGSRVDSAAAARAAQAFGVMSRERPGKTKAELEKEIRDAMYAPPFVPFLKGMVVASDGSVWLQRTEVTAHGNEWWILDSSGRLVGHVQVSAGLHVMLVQGDHLWGVETDDMGVNYIVRYRVERGRA